MNETETKPTTDDDDPNGSEAVAKIIEQIRFHTAFLGLDYNEDLIDHRVAILKNLCDLLEEASTRLASIDEELIDKLRKVDQNFAIEEQMDLHPDRSYMAVMSSESSTES